jgi:hypothetical protein
VSPSGHAAFKQVDRTGVGIEPGPDTDRQGPLVVDVADGKAASGGNAERLEVVAEHLVDRPLHVLGGRELTRLRLLQSLESLQNWNENLLGHPISFDAENHLGLNAVKLSRAEGGTLTHLSDWIEP